MGSLRDAIAHICPGGTINFDPAVFADAKTITLTSGELFIDTDMTIQGPAANLLSISGNNASRVVYVDEGITAKLDRVTIRDGNADDGAGITNSGNLTLSNSTITGNAALAYAGGIRNFNTLTVINGVVSGNTAVGGDGGFGNYGTMTVTNSTISGNTAVAAGGIGNYGTLTLTNSTISGNKADGGGGSYEYLNGGGIYNGGGTLSINNSTISGNTATKGGGIYNTYGWDDNGGTVYLTNITVSGNNGGGIFSDGSSETLRNTIVASNTGGDISGTIETAGHSLVGDAASAGGIQNGVDGNIVGVAPLLGPLQNNGGPTITYALLAGSPAINAGNNCVLTENGCGYTHPALPTDQRGFPRFGTVDIGAYECSVPTPTPTCASPIDSPDFFIGQQYRDFLNREGEADGLQFYLDLLNRCSPTDAECIRYLRSVVSGNFFRSPEFQRKGNYVMFLYMVSIGQRPVTAEELPTKNDPTLNDRPSYQEFVTDLASVSTPNDDPALTEQKKNDLVNNWMTRSQIVSIYGGLSNAQFVQKLIDVSGVTPANQNWVGDLNGGTKTRAQVLRLFAESPEVDAKFNKQSFVTMEYFGYLRRKPEDCHDPANWGGTDPNQCGFIFHNQRFLLSTDEPFIQNIIVRGFIESPEYRGRF